MRKMSVVFLCLAIVFSLAACADDAEFQAIENATIVATDGTEYTFVGNESSVFCLGEWAFIGHVKGEKQAFHHLDGEIKTGMYSVNDSRDVLVRYFPNNEFAAMYVKSELLKTKVALDQCIRFVFIKSTILNQAETTVPKNGITECERFLSEIQGGQTAKEAGLYDLVKQSDGTFKNCYVYGYVCGVLQDDIPLVIPLQVMSFDDKAYSIKINDIEYVLPQEWIDELMSK